MTGGTRATSRGRRPAALILALVIGVGLVLAPAIFGMFTRAPAGGAMLDDFRPFMDAQVLGSFQGHLDRIDAAQTEAAQLLASASAEGAVGAAALPATAAMNEAWPEIHDEMSTMLADISANVDNYAAVDALPPFALFPWFFVLPGLAIAVLAAIGLRTASRGRDPRRPVIALAVVGLATAAAPFAFQMFDRAPSGAAMIDDLRPLMTAERVQGIQGHFLTIAGFEGELRNELLAHLEGAGDPAEAAPAASAFTDAWPRIAAEMAPMIGAMSDNVDRFAGIDALPPFTLFPWFFVIPGSLVVASALWTLRVSVHDRPHPSVVSRQVDT